MPHYHKLIRDKIPKILRDKGIKATVRTANPAEYQTKLKEKLLEEVKEYLESENVEELADILEVIDALSAVHGTSRQEIERIKQKKAADRGGFSQKIILEETNQ